jgi:hypothetical protein
MRQSRSFGGGGWWVGYAIVDGSLGPYDVCGQSTERNLTLSDRVGRGGGVVPAPAVRRVAAVTATSLVVVDIAMSSLIDGGSRIHDEQKNSGDLWLSQRNVLLFFFVGDSEIGVQCRQHAQETRPGADAPN